MPFRSAVSRLFFAALRSLRVLPLGVLVTSAHAQLLPPAPRRDGQHGRLIGEVAPVSESPSDQPRELVETPFSVPPPHFSADLTLGIFHYLDTPRPEQLGPQRDDETLFAAGLIISGGQVIGLTEDKHWFLGIGTDRLAWAGSGGFAAYGKDRTVIVHGDTYPLIWGKSKHFIGESDVLVFGAADSDATLIWRRKIDLGKGERTIRVIEGLESYWKAAVRFDQGFVNGDLVFVGDGRADLRASNDDWHGNLTVRRAELHANIYATLRSLDSITIEHGGRFVIDNQGTSDNAEGGLYLANRLSQFISLKLSSAGFAYWGQKKGHSREHTGSIELLGGANIIDVVNYRPGQSTVLTIGGMYRNHGATLNLTNSHGSSGKFGIGGNTPQIKFRDNASPSGMPDLKGGIIPWATVNGTDFATVKGRHLVAYTDYNTGNAHTWNATTNASPTADQYLTTDHTVNSLRLDSGRKITLYGNTRLTLNAGALLSTGPSTPYNYIQGGELVVGGTGPREFYIHAHNPGWTLISSNISKPSNGEPISLIKTGMGALHLSGHDLSALTGTHYVNEGSLWIGTNRRGIGLGGHVIVGNRGLNYASLLLTETNAMQRSARITLRGITRKHSVHGSEYRVSSSILHITNAEHYLNSLNVDRSGLISFANFNSKQRLIAFEHITMADKASELFIEDWLETQTRLLIARTAGTEVAQYLDQIRFLAKDGSESTAHLIDYDSKYFEIVPTWYTGTPEPATTGAIVGAGALGFFAWRRRRVPNK